MNALVFGIVFGGLIMLVGWLRRASSRRIDRAFAEARVPELYATLGDSALHGWLGEADRRRLAAAIRVRVARLHADDAADAEAAWALTQILLRDLALVPGLSLRAAEEWRAEAPRELTQVDTTREADAWTVGGTLVLREQRLSLSLWGVRGSTNQLQLGPFEGDDVTQLCTQVRASLARALGVAEAGREEQAFARGRPRSLAGLRRAGALLQRAEAGQGTQPFGGVDLELEAHAVALLAEEPSLSILAGLLGPHRSADLLRLYEQDPHSVELCRVLAGQLQERAGFQREAFQFVRRALELSPADARSHLLAARSHEMATGAGLHAQLAHELAPRDSVAAALYARFLMVHAKDFRRAASIARAAIDLTPADPRSYYCLIDAHASLSDFERALEVGRELMGWLEPLHPRARAYLADDPQLRTRLEEGLYHPAGSLRGVLEGIERQREQASLAAAFRERPAQSHSGESPR
jgi:tetratricopeptide (TPR) repeat protein